MHTTASLRSTRLILTAASDSSREICSESEQKGGFRVHADIAPGSADGHSDGDPSCVDASTQNGPQVKKIKK